VYHSNGRLIAAMEKNITVAGESSIEWNDKTKNKMVAQSGAYLVEMIDKSAGEPRRLGSWRINVTR
jgi:flagellar hook assembly protein FlgD